MPQKGVIINAVYPLKNILRNQFNNQLTSINNFFLSFLIPTKQQLFIKGQPMELTDLLQSIHTDQL